MAKKIIKLKKRKILLAAICVFVLITAYYVLPFVSPTSMGELPAAHLRNVFANQSKIFAEPIASLGITGQPSTNFQCSDDLHTHWQTELLCHDYQIYPNDQSPISATAKNNFAVNAANFDELLKRNGWVNDRPHDPVTTLAGINPYEPQNGGLGGEVPFHKNIGSISCNLEVDFSGLSFPDNASPGSINVNEFSCQQTIKLFMPHFTNWQAPGP